MKKEERRPTQEQLKQLRSEAVDAMVRWGKKSIGLYTMRHAVNAYMRACGADNPAFDGVEGIQEKRRIVANNLMIDCIASLSSGQLHRLQMEMEQISHRALDIEAKPQIKR